MAAAAASPPVPLGPDASDLLDGDLRLKFVVAPPRLDGDFTVQLLTFFSGEIRYEGARL